MNACHLVSSLLVDVGVKAALVPGGTPFIFHHRQMLAAGRTEALDLADTGLVDAAT